MKIKEGIVQKTMEGIRRALQGQNLFIKRRY